MAAIEKFRRLLTVTIERPVDVVHAFLADPTNLPRWAKRVCRSIERSGDAWVARTPVGPVPLRFVTGPGTVELLPTYWPGQELSIPIRVREAPGGSTVEIELVKPRLMSEEEFPEDVALVEQDLFTLKQVLESELRGATTSP
jgi:hypothetical protein